MGAIPLPPKKSLAEHIAAQAAFLQDELKPRPTEARAGTRTLSFVDAAHFVQGSLPCRLWCPVRMFVRAASGRRRYDVPGAWNAVTRQSIRVADDTRVSSDAIAELPARIAGQASGAVTPVPDDARDQRCAAVMTEAARLHVERSFRPSYSPNRNRIERLWKFAKKKALRGKHDPDFAAVRAAIGDRLDRIGTDRRDALATLMTLHFQTFDNASFLAA